MWRIRYLNLLASQGNAFSYLASKPDLTEFNTALTNFTSL